MTAELGSVLLGPTHVGLQVGVADAHEVEAYHRLRREAFCDELGLFDGSDLDARDDDAVVLVARLHDEVVGGVRLFEVGPGHWQGGRLAVQAGDGRGVSRGQGVGRALVAAACAEAEARGALRFEATVLPQNASLFARLGWDTVGPVEVAGAPHVLVRYPVTRVERLVAGTKSALGSLLAGLDLGGDGFVGDDCAPVPGGQVLASVDAILPSMVARDPEWAGWCGVLVGANDLAAMGATPRGVLDSLGAPSAAHAARVLAGVRAASEAFGLPVLGGHTTLGAAPSLSVTALGDTPTPVPGAGRAGLDVTLTADLGGGWRPGHSGQWDSTSRRTREELAAMTSLVARARPVAAKDVSMAGVIGTLGMLAEASGCGAELDVAAVPRPAGATLGDWLTCFPGFAMLTADVPGRAVPDAGPATSAVCGRLVEGRGVRLRWPDGTVTEALPGAVTGMGAARA